MSLLSGPTGLLGQGFDDPRSAAVMALAGGLLQRNMGGGLLAANNAYGEAKQNALRQQMAQQQFEMQRQQHQLALEKAQRDAAMEAKMREAAQASNITPERATAMSMGPMPDGSAVPQVKPGFDMSGYADRLMAIDPMKWLQFKQMTAKDETPISVAPGASLVDRRTMKPVFTAPDKADKPPADWQLYQLSGAPQRGLSFDQWDRTRREASRVKVEVPINMGQKGLDNELSIHSKWRQEPIYKAHQEVKSAYGQITAALGQQSPAGDLAGATKLMKILDPGSVVRESELGMAMAATGALDRLTNYADSVIKGTKLTPSQRKDFQLLADRLAAESAKQYNAKRGEYAGFATDYQLNPARIVGAEEPVPKGGAAAPETSQKPRRYNPALGRIE